ncbi:MAG: protein kinase [Myxococcales bacterium]|nr:protein kinase [Myxococcales bacterium]
MGKKEKLFPVVARFFNEARAVNAINHPGIVQISDLGELPDGGLFLVMELLEGETLSARARRSGKRLSPEQAIRVGWQMASTLSAAHSKGVVHRDIKPSNVMIVSDPAGPGGERVKVLDFGIAKLATERGQTRTGQLMGTMAYISPEQIRSAAHVDGQSDVYSLGAMLFHLLASRPPFVSPDGEIGLVSMHLDMPPPELSQLAPGAPDALCKLIAQMLQKAAADRPTMTEVAERLQAMDAGASSRSLPPVPSAPPALPAADDSQLAADRATAEATQALAFAPAPQRASPTDSTLDASLGQTTKRAASPRRRRWLLAGSAAAGVSLIIALLLHLRRPGPDPTLVQAARSPQDLGVGAAKSPSPVPLGPGVATSPTPSVAPHPAGARPSSPVSSKAPVAKPASKPGPPARRK